MDENGKQTNGINGADLRADYYLHKMEFKIANIPVCVLCFTNFLFSFNKGSKELVSSHSNAIPTFASDYTAV